MTRRGPLIWLAVVLVVVAGCTPRLEPAGPVITAPRLADDHFVAADGAKLPVRRWLPPGPERAVIIGLHGFNDYSNAFDAPAAFWAAKGIATYAYDQRGFGDAPNPGIWAGAATMTDDLRAVVAAVRARHPGRPVYLVGVSMGGAVALGRDVERQSAAGRRRGPGGACRLGAAQPDGPVALAALGAVEFDALADADGAGAANPALRQHRDAARARPRQEGDQGDAGRRHQGACRPDGRGVRRHRPRSGCRCSFSTASATRSFPARRLSMPCARSRTTAPVRTALYANGYHMLLRDLKAETVLGDIATWVGDTKAPLPSGAERGPAHPDGLRGRLGGTSRAGRRALDLRPTCDRGWRAPFSGSRRFRLPERDPALAWRWSHSVAIQISVRIWRCSASRTMLWIQNTATRRVPAGYRRDPVVVGGGIKDGVAGRHLDLLRRGVAVDDQLPRRHRSTGLPGTASSTGRRAPGRRSSSA